MIKIYIIESLVVYLLIFGALGIYSVMYSVNSEYFKLSAIKALIGSSLFLILLILGTPNKSFYGRYILINLISLFFIVFLSCVFFPLTIENTYSSVLIALCVSIVYTIIYPVLILFLGLIF